MRTVIFILVALLWSLPAWSSGLQRGEVTWVFRPQADPGAKEARLWIPYPPTTKYQRISRPEIFGNFAYHGVLNDVRGNLIIYAEWDLSKTRSPEMKVRYLVERKEIHSQDLPQGTALWNPAHFAPYLQLDSELEGLSKLAAQITQGKTAPLAKARAIYDWVVENMRRDPKVRGCGRGDVSRLIKIKAGKCADISSVFVALCRAAGLPAGEVLGLRLGGKEEVEITSWQHCWAEFFLPGYGWVPVDPADVLKALLIKKTNLSDPEIVRLREYFFGGLDPFRHRLAIGRRLNLNPSPEEPPRTFFMYPHLEIDGQAKDPLDPKGFAYQIYFRPLVSPSEEP